MLNYVASTAFNQQRARHAGEAAKTWQSTRNTGRNIVRITVNSAYLAGTTVPMSLSKQVIGLENMTCVASNVSPGAADYSSGDVNGIDVNITIVK
jgi:nitrogen fixation protein FixH